MTGATEQTDPLPGVVEITPLVVLDLQERAAAGRARYGRPLEAGNGRDALLDAYQEALDMAQYLRQEIAERALARVLAEDYARALVEICQLPPTARLRAAVAIADRALGEGWRARLKVNGNAACTHRWIPPLQGFRLKYRDAQHQDGFRPARMCERCRTVEVQEDDGEWHFAPERVDEACPSQVESPAARTYFIKERDE